MALLCLLSRAVVAAQQAGSIFLSLFFKPQDSRAVNYSADFLLKERAGCLSLCLL